MAGRPWLLWLWLAFVPTGGALALGLGDIRVQSALNQPLVADIELVGASHDELRLLSAAVASRDTFLRLGADRPSFLSSVSFRVIEDGGGHASLRVRSAETFTEPFVTLLVEANWPGGKLVRDYALLLDPAAAEPGATPVKIPTATPATAATPATGATSPPAPLPTASVAVPPAQSVPTRRRARVPPRETAPAEAQAEAASPAARGPSGAPVTYTVRAGDTLDRIVRRLGGRVRASRARLADQLYRDNPAAFAGDPDHLYRGARLALPSGTAAGGDSADSGTHPAGARTAQTPPAQGPPAVVGRTPAVDPAAAEAATALALRLQELEQALADTRQAQAAEHAELVALREQVAESAEASRMRLESEVPASPAAEAAPVPRSSATLRWKLLGVAVAIVVLLLLLVRYVASRRAQAAWRTLQADERALADPSAPDAATEQEPPARDALWMKPEAGAAAPPEPFGRDALWMKPEPGARAADPVPLPVASSTAAATPAADVAPCAGPDPADYGPDTSYLSALEEGGLADELIAQVQGCAPEPHHEELPTVAMPVLPETTLSGISPDLSILEPDYMSADLELTSRRYDHAGDSAPRSNGTDALKEALRFAIEREPDRVDLRLKLLEVYYSTAISNHLAFYELASALSRERELLVPADQAKIQAMQQAIAAGPARAQAVAADDGLANCA